jgi:hypothetical protein
VSREINEYYLVGLAHTDLVVPAPTALIALAEARRFRQQNQRLLGYHPWAVPYLMEIDPAEAAQSKRLAKVGLAQSVKMVTFRDHSPPPPPPDVLPDRTLDTSKRNDALKRLADGLATLLEKTITHEVQEVEALAEQQLAQGEANHRVDA